MFRYLLVVLVVWCEIQRYAFAQDTSTQVLTIPNADNRNWTAITEELSKKPVIAMNGNNNYNVAQQIFYIYNEQQLKKILISNRHSEKMGGGTGVTTHKLVTRKVIWNTARQACNNEGGYLAIINSDTEEKNLINMLKEKGLNGAWLGVHDLYQEGVWVTVNGESLEETGYTRWSTIFPNEPDNLGGNQNCGLLRVEGGMDDDNCNTAYGYICETPA